MFGSVFESFLGMWGWLGTKALITSFLSVPFDNAFTQWIADVTNSFLSGWNRIAIGCLALGLAALFYTVAYIIRYVLLAVCGVAWYVGETLRLGRAAVGLVLKPSRLRN